MPATSHRQATAAKIALAVKKGEAKAKPGTPSAKMADMPVKSLKHFTKVKGKTRAQAAQR